MKSNPPVKSDSTLNLPIKKTGSYSGYNQSVPYRVQKPYVILNGQKVVGPNVEPQRMPFCDRCDELAATTASLYTELAPDKWWKWLSYPRFSEEEEAWGVKSIPLNQRFSFSMGGPKRSSGFQRTDGRNRNGMCYWQLFLL
jgi:hypothetical protein